MFLHYNNENCFLKCHVSNVTLLNINKKTTSSVDSHNGNFLLKFALGKKTKLSFSPCAGPVHHSDLACVWLKVTVHIKHVSKGSTAN